MAPRQQRALGVMIRMTVSARADGSILAPHIVPDRAPINADYYKNHISKTDVAPNIRSRVQASGGSWIWMQDLARPHTAKATIKYLKKEKIANMPWTPKGAG